MSMADIHKREKDVADISYLERVALSTFRDFVSDNKEVLALVSGWGDGRCGHLLEIMQEELGIDPVEPADSYKKAKISAPLRRTVFERDMYRCAYCDTHIDLTVDHIQPESLGGETKERNLQTLCRSCNSSKGVRRVY